MRRTEAGGGALPMPRGGEGRAFLRSLGHAWDGVVETAHQQRNMRIHLVAGLLVSLLGSGVPLGFGARLALLLCTFLVLSAEVANSALEAMVDLVSPQHHESARVAKDAGAGGVLVLAAGSVVVLALVLVEAWPSMWAEQGGLVRQAALGLPLAVAEALLLAPLRRPLVLDVVLVLGGALLLLVLASFSLCLVFTVEGALLFAVAAATARRARAEPDHRKHPSGPT